jgi:hypothetical protein
MYWNQKEWDRVPPKSKIRGNEQRAEKIFYTRDEEA